jgi:NAD-dependent DNA ligase
MSKVAKPKMIKTIKTIKKKKKESFDLTLINEVINDPTSFILDHDANTIISLMKYAIDKYYNDEAVLPDQIYDFLYDTIKDIDHDNPILKQVGSTTMSKNKVKLPYYMGSMDKIKVTDLKTLTKWKNDYLGPYVFSDKLDGVSGLLTYNDKKLHLYTRGDGIYGTNITNLINYLPDITNIDKSVLPDNFAVRGELIISKTNFKKYEETMSNARNMVAGIVNSKTIDHNIVTDVNFITYEIINPWIKSQKEQWELLTEYGFNVVTYDDIEELTFDELGKILLERKKKSDYEIDGIIVTNNELPEIRTINTNPEYSFAYKDINAMASANVLVEKIEWNISKDGYIKPTIKIVPTKLGGVIISSVTAHNAAYVYNNKLGKGSIIELIRSGDVIPYIKSVIKESETGEPQMPEIPYVWNETHVDIMITNESIDQKVKELTFFCKKLDIKNIDEASIRKMINVGIDTILKIINITEEQLLEVENFGIRLANKIYANISDRIKTLTILDLMAASNLFGHGMGRRKLLQIMKVYPDILDLYINNSQDEIVDMITHIDGYDIKTAKQFANGLDKFIELFNSLSGELRKQLRLSILTFINEQKQIKEDAQNDNKFVGNVFLFSGFRNKDFEAKIIKYGGKIASSISSNVTLLVTTQKDIDKGTNNKIIKAKKLGIRIINKEIFEQEYMS